MSNQRLVRLQIGEKRSLFLFFLPKISIDIFKRGQTQTLDGSVVAVKNPLPPVTKAGIKEYLLELIVDGDLVCCLHYFSSFDVSLY
jgi:hypothetical protein